MDKPGTRILNAAGTVTARAKQLGLHPRDLLTLIKVGVIRPMRPDKLLRILLAWRRWGITLPFGYAVGAIRTPDRPAVVDERGALSFGDIETRTTRLANGLKKQGVRAGDRVGVLCRNHHGLIETILACGKFGADVVLLNTGLAGGQLHTVLEQQRVRLLISDEEFAEHPIGSVPRVLAWTDGTTQETTLEYLTASSPNDRLPRPKRASALIVLTSGTTGSPKGARRPEPPGLSPAATMLSRIPLHSNERILVSAPLFHTWGLAAFQLGTVLGSTLVLQRKFDPQRALSAVQRHQCTALFVVPIMLQRILELPADVRTAHDHRSVHVVASSGSALPPDLANRFQRTFGGVLYNIYGSTEVSWVTIATPRELRQYPGTAGKPPRGTVLRIVDDAGGEAATGNTGRIFAANNMLFDGYTHEKSRARQDGLMPTGDLGRVDRHGNLFVMGREDDMIVSGGENVYPKETEDAIVDLPNVAEVAVIGVDDADFGQRLAAFVVARDGTDLDSDAVLDGIRDKLPKYALPRDVVFLDELPRNTTGKVVPSDLRHHLGGET